MKKIYLILLTIGMLVSNYTFAGDGSKENPFTVSEAINLATGSDMFWVQGYVVGGRYNDFEQPWENDYGVSIAESSSETSVDNCLQIKLETTNDHRTLWGLNSNPSVFGTEIIAHGFRDTYGGYPSFEGVDEIEEATSNNGNTGETTSAPTFSPAGGTYSEEQTVSIATTTADAVIYYTTNGETPTNASTVYSAPLTISESSTVKALAIKNEISSTVSTAEYIIQPISTEITIPFTQNFDTNLGNFQQISVSGAEVWKWGSFDDGCVTMSGYASSTNNANIDWLISPTFDFSKVKKSKLTFREAINYLTSYNELQVFVSTNYNGTSVTDATWTELTVTGRSAGDSWTFVDVDSISLAAFEGQEAVTIGFKYTSTTSGASSWEISKVVVTGTEATQVEPSNHVTNFTATSGTITETSIELAWNENDGAILPNGYLLVASTDSIINPTNGSIPADDTNLTDGKGNVKLDHGTTSYIFENCASGTTYNFGIFPFVETVDTVAFKTKDAPQTTATTLEAVLPIEAPTAFEANVASTSQINITWIKNTLGQQVILATELYDEVAGTPTEGATYTANDKLPGGGTVIYTGAAESFEHTNLEASSYYYYKIWSVSYEGIYSEGISVHAATLSPEPSKHAENFNADSIGKNFIATSWTNTSGDNAVEGYILTINDIAINLIAPIDGTPISGDTDLSDGTGAIVVSNDVEMYTWEGLNPGTTYILSIYPYSNAGEFIDYKTDDTPTLTVSTLAGIATPVITPAAGEYIDSVLVEISCATENATIYYTTNGDEPTVNSTLYSNAFMLFEDATVKAIAMVDDEKSAITASSFTITTAQIEVATPVITPENGEFSDSVVVSISCDTDGAQIYYTTDGSIPTEQSNLYTGSFNITENSTIIAIAFVNEFSSETTSKTYVIIETVPPVEVNTLAELRAGETDGTIYHYNAVATVTFAMNFRNQKYIQDETAAILIDDNSKIITESYQSGDGITDLTGTLTDYNGLLEFVPVKEAAKTTATYTPAAQTIEASEFNSNFEEYESELVRFEKIDFEAVTFANGTDYELTQNGEALILRSHFYDVDYIGSTYENKSVNIAGIALWHSNQAKVVPRSSSDIEIRTGVEELASNLKVYSYNKNIIIDGLQVNSTVTIYNINGRKIYQQNSINSNQEIISVNKQGVYLVNITGKTTKSQKVIIQ